MSPASAGISGSAPDSVVLPEILLKRLADGRGVTRRALAGALGVDVDEIAVQCAALEAAGLDLIADDAETLRLAASIRWLDVAAIEAALDRPTRSRLAGIECHFELESTNRHLLAASPPAPGQARIAMAEYQHGGRGRRGRRWTMPPAAGIALSAAWRFERTPAALSALGLAVGAAARRAIGDTVGIDVGLKWPNDLIVDGGKLGGILVELDQLAGGGCHVVAGVGINVGVPAACLARVSDFRHGARDLRGVAPGIELDRSRLAGSLIARLVELFAGFAESGFEPYRAEWLAAHVLDGEAVELDTPSGIECGTVRGIESDGALIVEDAGGERRRIIVGDVTVRANS